MEVVHSGLRSPVCVNLPLFHIVYRPTDLLINHGMANEACYSLFLEELQKECTQSQQFNRNLRRGDTIIFTSQLIIFILLTYTY